MHAVWSGCFILVAYIPWTRVLFSPTHTHTLSSPQHLVPCAPKSVFMILPGSPFHFASLYLSHIALKIEGNWARRWEEEYPCWDSFWTSAKHTRTYTHAQTSSTHISSSFYLILEGLRAGKESWNSPSPQKQSSKEQKKKRIKEGSLVPLTYCWGTASSRAKFANPNI